MVAVLETTFGMKGPVRHKTLSASPASLILKVAGFVTRT